ncbi:MAG: MBOAT family protein [Deltaproteobacteria bacterium]|nr:MBOAT family protein [Deltaproteobacteria bacterium]
MRFIQTEFYLFFFLLLICLYIFSDNNRIRKSILIFANYYFYAYWDWRFLGLIIITSFSDYTVGKALSKSNSTSFRKLLITISILINLCILAGFKYCNFFIHSLNLILEPFNFDLSTLPIILPLGISFYTFRTLTYTIDVYRKKIEPCSNFLDYAIFVSFFPTMVAGPIVRASELLPQLQCTTALKYIHILYGLKLFVVGAFLKIFVADGLAPFTNTVFDNIAVFSSLTIWLASLSYSIQLYSDFAGYSMMAIGISKAMGYDIPKNFDFPYLSTSISEFWKRWHITLSNWVRDYIYISLGGNRKGKIRTYSNLIFSMILCGLWHGAAWTFAFWGFYHGVALVINHVWRLIPKHRNVDKEVITPLKELSSHFITLLTVIVGWVFFRADGFGNALIAVNKMFYPVSGVVWYYPFSIFIILSFIIIHFIKSSRVGDCLDIPIKAWYAPAFLFCMIWLCLVFGPKEFTPFIYSQF